MAFGLVQLFRFIFVGGLAAATYYVVAMSFNYLSQLPVMLINSIAYGVGFIVSYIGQKYYTFKSIISHKKTLPSFAFVAAFGFVMNSLIVWAGISLGLSYAVAIFPAILIVTIITYFLQRYVVFK